MKAIFIFFVLTFVFSFSVIGCFVEWEEPRHPFSKMDFSLYLAIAFFAATLLLTTPWADLI